jgi:maleylpyruvate isomerase
MKLYGYWRSGTSYRTRLALAIKGIEVEQVAINLKAGAHHDDAYRAINPQGMVPTLELDDGTRIAQSGAIIQYVEERFPEPSLLPAAAKARARVRHLADIVGCDIHPINNLRILKYLKNELGQPQSEIDHWIAHWIAEGFAAYEALLADDPSRGDFSFGGRPGLADCYLVPQVYAARRFHVDLAPYPLIRGAEAAILSIEALKAASPEEQPDAVPDA